MMNPSKWVVAFFGWVLFGAGLVGAVVSLSDFVRYAVSGTTILYNPLVLFLLTIVVGTVGAVLLIFAHQK